MEVWVKKYYDARKMIIDLEEKLLNVKIKDQFIGTSASSVYTQPFGKNLYRVADVCEKVKKNENLWRDKYFRLRSDYVQLTEAILGDNEIKKYDKSVDYHNNIPDDKELKDIQELLDKLKENNNG